MDVTTVISRYSGFWLQKRGHQADKSACSHALMLSCSRAIKWCCRRRMMLWCRHVIWYDDIMLYCSRAVKWCCRGGMMLRCRHVTRYNAVLPWCYYMMLSRWHGMVWCCDAAMWLDMTLYCHDATTWCCRGGMVLRCCDAIWYDIYYAVMSWCSRGVVQSWEQPTPQ